MEKERRRRMLKTTIAARKERARHEKYFPTIVMSRVKRECFSLVNLKSAVIILKENNSSKRSVFLPASYIVLGNDFAQRF